MAIVDDVTEQPPVFRAHSSTLLWLWWTLATTLGGLASTVLIQRLVLPLVRLLNVNASAFLIMASIFLMVGVMQWLILRYYINNIALWILATAISGFVGWLAFLTWFVATPQQFLQALFSSLASAQLFLGVPQAALLHYRLQKGGLWIGINILGWMISKPVTQILLPLGDYASIIGGWGTWGLVTGVYLMKLLADKNAEVSVVDA